MHWTFESGNLSPDFPVQVDQDFTVHFGHDKISTVFWSAVFFENFFDISSVKLFFIPSTFANLSKIGLPDFSAELKHQDLMSDSLFCVGVLLVEANLGWGCPALFPSLHFS